MVGIVTGYAVCDITIHDVLAIFVNQRFAEVC